MGREWSLLGPRGGESLGKQRTGDPGPSCLPCLFVYTVCYYQVNLEVFFFLKYRKSYVLIILRNSEETETQNLVPVWGKFSFSGFKLHRIATVCLVGHFKV